MKRAHRKAHKVVWLILPVILLGLVTLVLLERKPELVMEDPPVSSPSELFQ